MTIFIDYSSIYAKSVTWWPKTNQPTNKQKTQLWLHQWEGEDTRNKISGAIDDFCKKHDIKLSKKDVDDLVDDIKDAATEV